MAGRAEAVERQRHARQRVALAHHADVFAVVDARALVGDQVARLRACRQVGHHGGKVAHGQVGGLVVQQLARVARGQRHHAQRDAWRLAFEDLHQWRYQHGTRRICHCQHEGGVGCRRVEIARRERLLQLRERGAHRRPERLRARRGLHALAAAHQQFVAQRIAQPAQGVAHGRLGERQRLGGACQVAFRHHGVEHAQQVQVEGSEIEGLHAFIITRMNDWDSRYKVDCGWGKPYDSPH